MIQDFYFFKLKPMSMTSVEYDALCGNLVPRVLSCPRGRVGENPENEVDCAELKVNLLLNARTEKKTA